MRKLAFLVIAVLVMSLSVRGSASAKGNDETIIVGGGNLAPYYYAIPGTPPIQGWLGLLASEGDQPAGRIADPAGASAMLAASYDVYFDDLPEQGAPHASYVPAAASHPTYLYWRAATGGMPYQAWFTLTDPARAYLDDAIKTAVAMKDVGSGGLETDWLASAVRHGRYFTGLAGTPSIISDEYVITDSAESMSGAALHRVTGDDARRLLDAYIATLHNWHPTNDRQASPLGSAAAYEYSVDTPNGRNVFSFVATAGRSITRVYAAEGSYFDPAPALNSLIARVIPRQAPASDARARSAPSDHEASRSAGIVAGSLAAGLLVALGIGAAWAHRSERSASD
jgi:hypothetical protein